MVCPVLVLCACRSTLIMLANIPTPYLYPQFCPSPGRILPFICFVCFELDRGPLINNLMLDWLSWCRILCSTVYPCASMKYFVHNACGRISSVPTISVSVELLVFVFCPLHMLVVAPFPRVSTPPVCPLQWLCAWCDASINQFKVLTLSTSSVNFMCFVPFRYSSTLNNFPQSSLSVFFHSPGHK